MSEPVDPTGHTEMPVDPHDATSPPDGVAFIMHSAGGTGGSDIVASGSEPPRMLAMEDTDDVTDEDDG